MTEIKTERLVLRPMRTSDVDALFAVFSHPDAMTYWSSPPHQDPIQTAVLIKETMQASPETTADFVIELEGQVIGKAGFWQMPEIGYVLHPDHWRRGFATEALRAVIDYGFRVRNLPKIVADVDPDNAASIGMLKKLGFVEFNRAQNTIQIGGKWFDSVYLELLNPLGQVSDNSV